MKNIDWNKIWIGIVLGVLVPLITYGLYYSVVNKYGLRRINVSLCIVANLIPFYLTLNKEFYNSTKGVLIATLFWGIVIAFLSFFTDLLHIL